MLSESPIEEFNRLGADLGIQLFVKRDDLLPFPLAGNKFRKLDAELARLETKEVVLISNGSVQSNHCRTLALMAAKMGARVHLVLHGDPSADRASLRIYSLLNATYDVVPTGDIAGTIARRRTEFESIGLESVVIPGGCHTRLGAISYRNIAQEVVSTTEPNYVVLASGTGATQGGIIAGAELCETHTRVVGISVARNATRGVSPIAEAARWAGSANPRVELLDKYIDGGYGLSSSATRQAVSLAWKYGLPLDPTYTGKAFAGLLDLLNLGTISRGSRVLFWHTGGLWNSISALSNAHPSP